MILSVLSSPALVYGLMDFYFFHDLLEKVGFSLGSRAVSFALRGVGCSCSAGLALTVGFALQALLTGEGFTNMMAPAVDSGASEEDLYSCNESGDSSSSPSSVDSEKDDSEFRAADEESKGSDSSSSSEDSLKVHDGSADGRADASLGTPATRIESPAASDSDSPRDQKWDIVDQGELDFWHEQIRKAFDDALNKMDPHGRYGTIPPEQLFDALRLNRRDPINMKVGEMEKICKALRDTWPSREDADRTSIHHRIWELLEKHRRPEE